MNVREWLTFSITIKLGNKLKIICYIQRDIIIYVKDFV